MRDWLAGQRRSTIDPVECKCFGIMADQLGNDSSKRSHRDIPEDDVRLFREKLCAEIEHEKQLYHPKDVEMIKSNHDVCCRYICHRRRNIDSAVNMAKKSLQWRNEFGVNDLTESNIFELYLAMGSFIPFKKDKRGSQCIIFRTRLHRKDAARALDMKRYLVFWVEKCMYQLECPRITFIFDSTNATYASMDLDQVTFLIKLFSELYPWALGHVIVYNMPWILKTVWVGIQALIPSEGADCFKFCNGKDIFQLIEPDCLPQFMGGNVPVPFRELTAEEIDAVPTDPVVEKRICLTPAITKFYRDNFGLFRNSVRMSKDYETTAAIFCCEPDEQLQFRSSAPGGVQTASLQLTNCSADGLSIVYKVKVNCLQGFAVKPFCGVLENGSSVLVQVNRDAEFPISAQDKLLVQAIATDEPPTPQNLAEFWQAAIARQDHVFQKKLCCCLVGQDAGDGRPEPVSNTLTRDRARGGGAGVVSPALVELKGKVEELNARCRIQQAFSTVLCLLVLLNVAIDFHSKICHDNSAANKWYC